MVRFRIGAKNPKLAIFGDRFVNLEEATMRNTGASDEAVDYKCFENIGHGRGKVVSGKLGDHPAAF
jgi:hypothetical protein